MTDECYHVIFRMAKKVDHEVIHCNQCDKEWDNLHEIELKERQRILKVHEEYCLQCRDYRDKITPSRCGQGQKTEEDKSEN